uniref:(northern house mosquito) hypothetical protein n=1 Tax=Culex pipiens TaxID=7175 RepID=A0A8D8CRU3_CULPI
MVGQNLPKRGILQPLNQHFKRRPRIMIRPLEGLQNQFEQLLVLDQQAQLEITVRNDRDFRLDQLHHLHVRRRGDPLGRAGHLIVHRQLESVEVDLLRNHARRHYRRLSDSNGG